MLVFVPKNAQSRFDRRNMRAALTQKIGKQKHEIIAIKFPDIARANSFQHGVLEKSCDEPSEIGELLLYR